MTFLSERSADQRHDTIAPDLDHRPAIGGDGIVHHSKDRIEQSPRGFGVETADQLGRFRDIGEHHRDLFALALEQGRLRGSAAFRSFAKVVSRTRQRESAQIAVLRGSPCLLLGRAGKRGSAPAAEPSSVAAQRTAVWTVHDHSAAASRRPWGGSARSGGPAARGWGTQPGL